VRDRKKILEMGTCHSNHDPRSERARKQCLEALAKHDISEGELRKARKHLWNESQIDQNRKIDQMELEYCMQKLLSRWENRKGLVRLTDEQIRKKSKEIMNKLHSGGHCGKVQSDSKLDKLDYEEFKIFTYMVFIEASKVWQEEKDSKASSQR